MQWANQNLRWTGCGDANTFFTIVGLDPENIAFPGKTSLTGSGFLSADEAGGMVQELSSFMLWIAQQRQAKST